jgi:glycosyltransferase involved in cell wall biosynthesis
MNQLTFVVPAYKNSPYLEECIQSLLAQTIPCRIIITTSTPNEAIRALSRKFEIPLIENNQGGSITKDWGFALTQAHKNIVTLAHQDDLYDPLYAEKILSTFNAHPQCAIAFTDSSELINCTIYKNNKRELIKKILRKIAFGMGDTINSKAQYRLLLGFGCPIPCPSVAYNFNILNNFSFSDKFSVNLDWDAWSRMANDGYPISYIRAGLVTHRIHADAETQKGIKENRREKEDLEIFLRYWPPFFAKILLRLYKYSY